MGLTSNIKDKDWVSVRQGIAKLGSSKLGTGSSPIFVGLTLTGLTASRLVWTDAAKALESKDLIDLITGTANQVTATDDGDGSVTLSTPQDIHTGASPTFAGMTSTGAIDASAGEVLTEDNATTEPRSETDGYVGVSEVAGNARIYFSVEGNTYYVDGTLAPSAGSPIGLLLSLTYS